MDQAKIKRVAAILGWVGFAIGFFALLVKMLRPRIEVPRKENPLKAPATKFKAELWTMTSDGELWAVTMLDGDDAGWPCSFGPKEKMEKYAEQLNASQGVLR